MKYIVVTPELVQVLQTTMRWENIHGQVVPQPPWYILRVADEEIRYPEADEEEPVSLLGLFDEEEGCVPNVAPQELTIMPLFLRIPLSEVDRYVYADLSAAQKALAAWVEEVHPWLQVTATSAVPVFEAHEFFEEPRVDMEHPDIVHAGYSVICMVKV